MLVVSGAFVVACVVLLVVSGAFVVVTFSVVVSTTPLSLFSYKTFLEIMLPLETAFCLSVTD